MSDGNTVNVMRTNRRLINALAEITASANDILEELPAITLTAIAVTLGACDGDLPKAAQTLVNLHVRKISRQTLARIQEPNPRS